MNNPTYQIDKHLLAQRQEFDDQRVLIGLGSIFTFWILLAGFMMFSGNGYEFLNVNLFPLTLFGGGLICTIYYQLNPSQLDHLSSITIRTRDTFFNQWFISALLFPTVMTMLFWSYSIFADEFYHYYLGANISTFNPIHGESLPYIEVYVLLQFIYLIVVMTLQKIPLLIKYVRLFFKQLIHLFICVVAIRILLIDYIKSYLFQHLFKIENREKIKIS